MQTNTSDSNTSDSTQNTQTDNFDNQMPVYQTSIAVNLAIAITSIFVVFNGPRVGC
jgi:hypothetical protein